MTRPLSRINLALNCCSVSGVSKIGKAPDEFSNLDIWWDPSDSSNRTTTGTTIETIDNKGDGGTATLIGPGASTPVRNKPELVTQDGIEWAEFDTTDGRVIRLPNTNTVFRRGTSNFTMAVVFRSTQSTNFNTFMLQGITSGTAPGFEIDAPHITASGTNRGLIRDGTTLTASATHIDTNLYDGETHTIFITRNNSGGANGELYLYLDGVLEATTALPAFFGSINNTSGGAWTDLFFGARPAGGSTVYQNFSTHLMGDTLIYGQAFSDQDVSDLHDWLMNKWSS